MIAQPTRAKPTERSQPGRHDDRARVPEKSGSRGTQFDARYWLEHYRATHSSADSSDCSQGAGRARAIAPESLAIICPNGCL